MKLEAGTQLRDYEIVSVISDSGGMGVVYLAKDKLLGRQVAIKVLKPALLADELFTKRFQHEAQIQSRLRHPNIVSLIAFFEEADNYYMVMEYCSGITIKDLITRVGPIPQERALRIFLQICRALDYAHSIGVIHRDIKPSNVIVNVDLDDEIKMMDFGIAKMLSDQHLTQTGSLLGTPNYMSPEQIVSPKNIDHRSDIFSAGVLLFEMLTGRLPYDTATESDFKLQQQIVQQELPDPRNFYPNMSEWLVDLVYAMCNKDRDQRYQSMGEVKEFIESQLQSGQYYPQQESLFVENHSMVQDSAQDAESSGEYQVSSVPEVKKPKPLAVIAIIGVVIVIALIVLLSKNTGSTQSSNTVQTHQIQKRQRQIAVEEPESRNTEDPKMVYVASGGFYMGHHHTILTDERPVHWVNLNAFYMAKYETTVAEFTEIMDYNPYNDNDASLPVRYVSWYEAIEYCNRLSRKNGYEPCYSVNGDTSPSSWSSGRVVCNFSANGYRLPTEAEWEYAAREGRSELVYNHSGSNSINEVAWYLSDRHIDPQDVDIYDLWPSLVGKKKSNSLGIYDMTGNVWEWVWDRYSETYYAESPDTNPKGPDQGNSRVLRGGAFDSEPGFSYVSTRGLRPPGTKHRSYGFRVCRNAG